MTKLFLDVGYYDRGFMGNIPVKDLVSVLPIDDEHRAFAKARGYRSIVMLMHNSESGPYVYFTKKTPEELAAILADHAKAEAT